jgi:hypothetical protein
VVTASNKSAEVSSCDQLPDLSTARLRWAAVRRTRFDPGPGTDGCLTYSNYLWIDQKSDGSMRNMKAGALLPNSGVVLNRGHKISPRERAATADRNARNDFRRGEESRRPLRSPVQLARCLRNLAALVSGSLKLVRGGMS